MPAASTPTKLFSHEVQRILSDALDFAGLESLEIPQILE